MGRDLVHIRKITAIVLVFTCLVSVLPLYAEPAGAGAPGTVDPFAKLDQKENDLKNVVQPEMWPYWFLVGGVTFLLSSIRSAVAGVRYYRNSSLELQTYNSSHAAVEAYRDQLAQQLVELERMALEAENSLRELTRLRSQIIRRKPHNMTLEAYLNSDMFRNYITQESAGRDWQARFARASVTLNGLRNSINRILEDTNRIISQNSGLVGHRETYPLMRGLEISRELRISPMQWLQQQPSRDLTPTTIVPALHDTALHRCNDILGALASQQDVRSRLLQIRSPHNSGRWAYAKGLAKYLMSPSSNPTMYLLVGAGLASGLVGYPVSTHLVTEQQKTRADRLRNEAAIRAANLAERGMLSKRLANPKDGAKQLAPLYQLLQDTLIAKRNLILRELRIHLEAQELRSDQVTAALKEAENALTTKMGLDGPATSTLQAAMHEALADAFTDRRVGLRTVESISEFIGSVRNGMENGNVIPGQSEKYRTVLKHTFEKIFQSFAWREMINRYDRSSMLFASDDLIRALVNEAFNRTRNLNLSQDPASSIAGQAVSQLGGTAGGDSPASQQPSRSNTPTFPELSGTSRSLGLMGQ